MTAHLFIQPYISCIEFRIYESFSCRLISFFQGVLSILGEAEHQAHLFQGLVTATGAETRPRHLLPCGVSTCFRPPKPSLVAQTVKRLPTMRETWVRSLGGVDPLGKEMATHSCLEKSHGWRSLVGYSPWGRRAGHD